MLGIDIGTTGCKAVVYNLEGRVLGKGYREIPVLYPKQTWVEQDPQNWFIGVTHSIRQATQGISPHDILAIGVSTANGAVFVDDRGNAVRPAIMQLDRRAKEEAKWAEANINAEELFSITGNRLSVGMSWVPTLLWVKKYEPSVYEKIRWVLSPGGYIVYSLTGKACIDPSRAAPTGLLNIYTGEWSYSLCDVLQLRRTLLPPVMGPSEIAGVIKKEAAEYTGLIIGTPVGVGCMDTLAATQAAGVGAPGEECVILGSIARLCRLINKPLLDNRFLNTFNNMSNAWLVLAPISGVGTSVRWFRELLGNKFTFEQLDNMAYQANSAEADLIYLPYLEGSLSPHWNPYVRGTLLGIQPYHGPGQVLKAIYQGTSYAILENEILFNSLYGPSSGPLPVCGGGALSKIWPQVLSDILSRTVVTRELESAEAAGAASLAISTVHGNKSTNSNKVREFISNIRGVERIWKPREEIQSKYFEGFAKYQIVSKAIRNMFIKSEN